MAALALAGCGVNNPGDPVRPTRALVAPAPPDSHADVYCVPDTYEDGGPQTCSVDLRVGAGVSDEEALAWWYRAAEVLRPRMGVPFDYQGVTFRYRGLYLDRRTDNGDWAGFGWRCPADKVLSEAAARGSALHRGPFDPGGFRSAAAARAAGCTVFHAE